MDPAALAKPFTPFVARQLRRRLLDRTIKRQAFNANRGWRFVSVKVVLEKASIGLNTQIEVLANGELENPIDEAPVPGDSRA